MAEAFNPNLGPEVKSWKFKIERVAKGYCRVTVHSDDIDELMDSWQGIHDRLIAIGESVEKIE